LISSPKVIALTGVNGFLGSWLANGLLDAGYEIKGIRRRTSDMIRITNISNKITWLDIDIASDNELDYFLRGVNTVIHTVGNYGRRGESISEIVDANLMFGLRIIESVVRVNVPNFINTATSLPKNTNYYTISKAQFSDWGRRIANEKKLLFFDVRLEHIYGPGDDKIKFIQYVVEACLGNEKEINLTSGRQTRDFIYINDVVAAFLTIINSINTLESKNCYEIPLGSGEPVSVRSVVELIHRITKSQTYLNFGSMRLTDKEYINSTADIGILKSLGWIAQIPLEEGLIHIINHQKSIM
jgi:CDP-paratose synthetase